MTPAEPVTPPQTTGAPEMDDVMARMRELATHRGDEMRRSKRDRSALKTTFRDLVSSVEVFCRRPLLSPYLMRQFPCWGSPSVAAHHQAALQAPILRLTHEDLSCPIAALRTWDLHERLIWRLI